MASFSTAELMKPGRKTVSVRYTVKKDEINADSKQPITFDEEKKIETIKSITLSGYGLINPQSTTDLSGIVESEYSQIDIDSNGGGAPQSAILILVLTYTVQEYRASYVCSVQGELIGKTEKKETESIEGIEWGEIDGLWYELCYEKLSGESGGYLYWHEIYELIDLYEWEKKDNEKWLTTTHTVGTYYKSPAAFNFANCERGQKWRVDDGIDSLITNINSFPAYATQWKAWKHQSNPSSCPSFDSPLSANNLNSIYAYVGKTGNFNPGDPISAAMFNGLADVINNDA